MAASDPSALLAQLTVAEKASLCLGSDFWHTRAIERLGIAAVHVSDGPHGLRVQPERGDHVGEGGSLPATCFPTASALGSSFDVDLAARIGSALGREARAQGVSVVLGPGVNIKRSPLCGRNFEYLSEDPVVSGVLAAAWVSGLQEQGVGASVKHFAANNQETDRLRVSADVDQRTLREIYLPAFERVVIQSRPWTVMCSYNKINGVYASEDHWLLTDLLRGEWGFEGLVVSDWGAVHDRVAALAAGLDLEMPPNLGISDVALVAAVTDGTLPESVLDIAAERVLRLGSQAAGAGDDRAAFDVQAHHELARQAARECAVLLKNDDGLLPLRLDAGDTIAVIGEFARTPRFQGAGSSQVNPTRVDVALDELRRAVPAGVEVAFTAGYGLGSTAGYGLGSTAGFGLEDVADAGAENARLADEAVELAARAQVVVAFLGLPTADESEGFDRTHIQLPANQIVLLTRLAAANPKLAVVLANGSVVQVSDWQQHAGAILECWLSGQAAGGAAADLLLGAANPCGRLAETVPIRLEDNSAYLNFPGEAGHVRYGEGVFVGYRSYDRLSQDVSYPFGHGLSYTTFEYTDLVVAQTGSYAAGDLAVSVSCQVRNTGERTGKDVVQLYVGDVEASVARPVRELRQFAKVELAPGRSTAVTFALDARDFSFWSVRTGRWTLEAGQFELSVGASSRDLRLRATIEVDAPTVRPVLTSMSTLQEWLADPQAGPALRAAVGVDDQGRPRGILGNDGLISVIGNFPVSTLSAFAGMGIDREMIDRLLPTAG